jgi:NAD(P)-dependent dehydrogenase (short-subunit alcohol dehydrogenase family)
MACMPKRNLPADATFRPHPRTDFNTLDAPVTIGSTVERALPNVIVTGAARRLGRAMAADLARRGYGLAIHCHRAVKDGEALVESILREGGRAKLLTGDLTNRKVLDGLVDRAAAALGPISILVNNASAFHEDLATNFAWEAWDDHFRLHVEAPVMLSRRFAEALPAGTQGLVVNMIDQRVLKPTPTHFTYGLSKSALWSATRLLAQSLAPSIRVNAIGPGPSMASERQTPQDFDLQTSRLMLGRGPALSEFAATVDYLWNARSITGQMILLDGGQHLAWQTPDVAGIRE